MTRFGPSQREESPQRYRKSRSRLEQRSSDESTALSASMLSSMSNSQHYQYVEALMSPGGDRSRRFHTPRDGWDVNINKSEPTPHHHNPPLPEPTYNAFAADVAAISMAMAQCQFVM